MVYITFCCPLPSVASIFPVNVVVATKKHDSKYTYNHLAHIQVTDCIDVCFMRPSRQLYHTFVSEIEHLVAKGVAGPDCFTGYE